jgi:hypothetical protein
MPESACSIAPWMVGLQAVTAELIDIDEVAVARDVSPSALDAAATCGCPQCLAPRRIPPPIVGVHSRDGRPIL